MRLKDLFTVPAGQKVTERHLRRVLVSSICSILLCMSCLVGTTWAWFTVSLENTDNVIQIGPDVAVTVDGAAFVSGETLAVGTHGLQIGRTNGQADLGDGKTLYVELTFNVGGEDTVRYVALPWSDSDVTVTATVSVVVNADCTLSWRALWTVPTGTEVPSGDTITVPAVNTTNLDEESAGDPGEEAADAGDESAEGTPDTGAEPGEDTSTGNDENTPEGTDETGDDTTGENDDTTDDPTGEQSETDEMPDGTGETTPE